MLFVGPVAAPDLDSAEAKARYNSFSIWVATSSKNRIPYQPSPAIIINNSYFKVYSTTVVNVRKEKLEDYIKDLLSIEYTYLSLSIYTFDAERLLPIFKKNHVKKLIKGMRETQQVQNKDDKSDECISAEYGQYYEYPIYNNLTNLDKRNYDSFRIIAGYSYVATTNGCKEILVHYLNKSRRAYTSSKVLKAISVHCPGQISKFTQRQLPISNFEIYTITDTYFYRETGVTKDLLAINPSSFLGRRKKKPFTNFAKYLLNRGDKIYQYNWRKLGDDLTIQHELALYKVLFQKDKTIISELVQDFTHDKVALVQKHSKMGDNLRWKGKPQIYYDLHDILIYRYGEENKTISIDLTIGASIPGSHSYFITILVSNYKYQRLFYQSIERGNNITKFYYSMILDIDTQIIFKESKMGHYLIVI